MSGTSIKAQGPSVFRAWAGLGLCLAFAGGAFAQDAKKEPAPPPPLADAPGRIEPPPQGSTAVLPAGDSLLGKPATPNASAVPAPPLVTAEPLVAPDALVPVSEVPQPGPGVILAPAPGGPSQVVSAALDDPEKTAQAFVERNRKFAEAHLNALKEEAERLRARLEKVESGIKRWESLLDALKQNEPTPNLEPRRRSSRVGPERRSPVAGAGTDWEPVPSATKRSAITPKLESDRSAKQDLLAAPPEPESNASAPKRSDKGR